MKKQPEMTEKTRQKFVDAFWSLIKEKPISKISVSELTRRAGYNRSTFYEYFLDTDDLLDYVETQLLEEVKQTVRQIPSGDNLLENLFQIIFATMNEKIYLLMGANGDSGFLKRVTEELLPLVKSYLPISANRPDFDYLITFLNSASFGLLQHWNEKNKDLSTEEISTLMQNLVLHGVLDYITPENET